MLISYIKLHPLGPSPKVDPYPMVDLPPLFSKNTPAARKATEPTSGVVRVGGLP